MEDPFGPPIGRRATIDVAGLGALLARLVEQGWRIVGPTVRDGAIVHDEIASVDDLPTGWGDEQDGGVYRLKRRSDDARFGFAVGADSWKAALHPARTRLWSAERHDEGVEMTEDRPTAPRTAFVGVRACDLAAVGVLGRVLTADPADPAFAARRAATLIIAVNCGSPAGTCFCVSMGTGPRVLEGADLVLTEVLDGGHRFVVEVGSAAGAELLEAVAHTPAQTDDLRAAEAVIGQAEQHMGRSMDTERLSELLAGAVEHDRWDDVASRCLSCGNCTLVCPTCFCTATEDHTDLSGMHAERWQRWDSCFSLDHSYVHGGPVRASVRSRYRQWLTHKLGTWHDQFGESGCVGCGRCITWCPVGIDLTTEVRAIRAAPAGTAVGLPRGRGG